MRIINYSASNNCDGSKLLKKWIRCLTKREEYLHGMLNAFIKKLLIITEL